MRQPTFSRSSRRRVRQQRLLRTGIGFVALVAIIALVGKCAGGDKPPEEIARVAFVATARAESDGKSPGAATVKAESDAIVAMLNDWYQRAFVDPRLFGDGTFTSVASHFTAEARASFTKDIKSLTIGDAREEVERVRPQVATADVTVFFEAGATPRFAVAAVTFKAKGTMKNDDAYPIQIAQQATLHLQKSGGTWLVTYYTAGQTQDSIVPAPSPSVS